MRRIAKRSDEETRASDLVEEYQKERIHKYNKDITFVKKYYEGIGKLVNVDGTGDPNTVLRRILNELRVRKLVAKV